MLAPAPPPWSGPQVALQGAEPRAPSTPRQPRRSPSSTNALTRAVLMKLQRVFFIFIFPLPPHSPSNQGVLQSIRAHAPMQESSRFLSVYLNRDGHFGRRAVFLAG